MSTQKYKNLRKQYSLIEKNGYLQVFPIPKDEELKEWYENEYFFNNPSTDGDLEISHEITVLFSLILQVLDELSNKYIYPKTILDLGCGEGYFSRLFKSNGFITYSADFTDKTVKICSPSLLNDCKYFESGDVLNKTFFDNKAFDFVFVKNLIEHVKDPVVAINSIHNYLLPDGVACISVPNDYSIFHKNYLKDLAKEEAGFFIPPTHLNYFNIESFKTFLTTNDFEIIDAFSDFPMEQFLLTDDSNYYYKPDFGPIAHNIRTNFMSILAEHSIKNSLNLCREFYKNNIGRNSYVFVKSKNHIS